MIALLRDMGRHPSGRIGFTIVALFVLAAALAELGFTPYDPLAQDRLARLQGPSGTHLFGTDLFGDRKSVV